MQYALNCFTTILNAVLCFLLLHRRYEQNLKNIVARIVFISIYILTKLMSDFLQIPPLNFVSSLLMVYLIIRIFYECYRSTAILYSSAFIMLILVTDALSNSIVSLVEKSTISEVVYENKLFISRYLLDWIMEIIFTRMFILLINKKTFSYIKWNEIFFYIILTLFETGIFAYVSYMVQDNSEGTFIIIMMLGFLILDLYMMYILHKVSSSREAGHEIELMRQQEQLQMQMYLELQKKYDLSRSVTHDVNRHIRSLEKLIEHNSTEKAEQYFKDLHKSLNRLNPMVKNQNTMLAIILNTAAERAETEKIKLDMDIEDFSIDFMRDIDITTIFSNILDNAIEACCELPIEKRKFHITLRNKLDLMILRMTNPCVYNTNRELSLHSSKIGHSGIGLLNVKNVVEQYDGVMEIIRKDNQFQIAITIPINNNQNKGGV